MNLEQWKERLERQIASIDLENRMSLLARKKMADTYAQELLGLVREEVASQMRSPVCRTRVYQIFDRLCGEVSQEKLEAVLEKVDEQVGGALRALGSDVKREEV